uniref:Histone deacetylase n=1 Tax=Macrostomum lignano TaxID=282301 RepID=A0A1I8JM60_9PLAT
LTAEDINFIQQPLRRGSGVLSAFACQPGEGFHLAVPSLLLKQNFNLAFIAPQYRDHACQFPLPVGPPATLATGEIYLSPSKATILRLISTAGVAMETVARRPVAAAPRDPARRPRLAGLRAASAAAPDPEFKVWKRGGVTVEGLVERVSTCVRHALEDLAMEHTGLLTLPFSEVPQKKRPPLPPTPPLEAAAAAARAKQTPPPAAADRRRDDSVAAAATPSERDSPLMSPGGSRRLTASAASRSQQQQLQAPNRPVLLLQPELAHPGHQSAAAKRRRRRPLRRPRHRDALCRVRDQGIRNSAISGCMNPPCVRPFSKKSSSDQDHQPCQQRSLYSAKSIGPLPQARPPGCLPNLTYAVYEASPGSDPSGRRVDSALLRHRHSPQSTPAPAGSGTFMVALPPAGPVARRSANRGGPLRRPPPRPADAAPRRLPPNDGASESGSVAGGGVSAPLLQAGELQPDCARLPSSFLPASRPSGRSSPAMASMRPLSATGQHIVRWRAALRRGVHPTRRCPLEQPDRAAPREEAASAPSCLSHLIPADSMRGPIVNYLHPSAPGGQSASTSAGGVSASSAASAAVSLLRLAQMQESRLHHWRKLSALHNDAYGSSATIDLFGSAQLAASGLSPQDLPANRPRQARFSLGQQQQPPAAAAPAPSDASETSAPTVALPVPQASRGESPAPIIRRWRRRWVSKRRRLLQRRLLRRLPAGRSPPSCGTSPQRQPSPSPARPRAPPPPAAAAAAAPTAVEGLHGVGSSASLGGSGAWYAQPEADMVRAYSDYLTRKDKLFGNYKLLLLAPAAPGAELLPNMPAPHLGLHYRLLVKSDGQSQWRHRYRSVLPGRLPARPPVRAGGQPAGRPPGGAFHLVKSASRHIVECAADAAQDLCATVRRGVSFCAPSPKAIQQPPLYANHYAYVTQFSATSRNIAEKRFSNICSHSVLYVITVPSTTLSSDTVDFSSSSCSSGSCTASFPIQKLLRLVGGFWRQQQNSSQQRLAGPGAQAHSA